MKRALILMFFGFSSAFAKIPPSAQACKTEGTVGFFMDVAALVWQSKEGSMEYAAKEKFQDTPKITFITPDFGWRPGIKADLGYYLPHDDWDIKGTYTYYHGEMTMNKKHVNVHLYPGENGVIATHFYPFYLNSSVTPTPHFEHAAGNLHIYFNTFDLELGRNFWVGKKFSFRPLGGIKGAWIRQKYQVYYEDGNVVIGDFDNLQFLSSSSFFKNNSVGVGPRLGFEAKCYLKWGIELLANGSFNYLPTQFKIKRHQVDEVFNFTTSNNERHELFLSEHKTLFLPNIDLQLGFGYGRCFCHSYLGFFLSYEMQYYWAQNQIRRFVSSANEGLNFPSRGDLQLHGLTAFLKFEF